MDALKAVLNQKSLITSSFFKTLAFVSIISIFTIILFSTFIFLPAFLPVFDFSQSHKLTIATVIANLAAPILAAISSVLLYLALVKQTESNKFQLEKSELDMCFTLYNQLNTEYANTTIKKEGTRTTNGVKEKYLEIYHGHQALVESLHLIRGDANNFAINFETDKFMSMISTFELTEKAVEKAQINKELKVMFKNKLDKFYAYKLRSVFLLTFFLIKDNKDQISKDFMTFVQKNELKKDSNFDINTFSNESEVFRSALNPSD